jgi:hypothetical protein
VRTFKWIVLLALIGSIGCAKKEEEEVRAPEVKELTPTSASQPEKTYTQPLTLSKDGKDWICIEFTGNGLELRSGNQVLILAEARGQCTINGTLYSVKRKDYGYKVYDREDKLLLKVKRYPDKIKIGQSEDDLEAWTLRPKSADPTSYKVKRGDTELGKISYYAEQNLVKAKDRENSVLCRVESSSLLQAPAVAFMDDLSLSKQLMVCAFLTVMEE